MSEFMNEFLKNIVNRHTDPKPNLVKPRLRGIYEGRVQYNKLQAQSDLKYGGDEISGKDETGFEKYEPESTTSDTLLFKEPLNKNKGPSAKGKEGRYYQDAGSRKLNISERKDSYSSKIERIKPVTADKYLVDSSARDGGEEKGSQKQYPMEKGERSENTDSLSDKLIENKNRVKKYLTFNWPLKTPKRSKAEKKSLEDSSVSVKATFFGKTGKTSTGKEKDTKPSVSKRENAPANYQTDSSNKNSGESEDSKLFRLGNSNKKKEDSRKNVVEQIDSNQYRIEKNIGLREHHVKERSSLVGRTSSYDLSVHQNTRLKLPLQDMRPDPQQTIRVSIGQIVVKAVKQERTVPQKPANTGRFQPKIPLSDYLSQK